MPQLKVLHTSDWHLGRSLNSLDQADEQRTALEWIVQVVKDEKIDVVLVSGDIYDTRNPKAQSVDMLNDVLTELTQITRDGKPAVDVVLIPGNHDSPVKLGFLSRLVPPNLHIRVRVEDIAKPVIVEREGQKLAVYAFPFLAHSTARFVLSDLLKEADPSLPRDEVVVDDTTQDVAGAAITLASRDLAERRKADPDLAAILMMHATVASRTPGTIGEKKDEYSAGETEHAASETPQITGTVEAIPSGYFAGSGFDYLALGHIHQPQTVTIVGDGKLPQARYCGSLLAYDADDVRQSVPRVGNYRIVELVTIENGAVTAIEDRYIDSGQKRIVNLTGDLDYILGPETAEYRDDLVNIHASYDPAVHKDPYAEVTASFSHILASHLSRKDGVGMSASGTAADRRDVNDPMSVMESFFKEITHAEADDIEKEVFREALERALKKAEGDDSEASAATGNGISKASRRPSGRKTAYRTDAGASMDSPEGDSAASSETMRDAAAQDNE